MVWAATAPVFVLCEEEEEENFLCVFIEGKKEGREEWKSVSCPEGKERRKGYELIWNAFTRFMFRVFCEIILLGKLRAFPFNLLKQLPLFFKLPFICMVFLQAFREFLEKLQKKMIGGLQYIRYLKTHTQF